MATRLVPFLSLVLALSFSACASDAPAEQEAEAVVTEHPALTRQMAFTHTHEVNFGESEQVVGYLVEFLRVPEGVVDERTFPAGTVLLQDLEFKTVGLITPGQEGVAFDDQGVPTSLGHGGREQLVMAMFERSERPHFRSIMSGQLLK